MLGAAASFVLLELLPINFGYVRVRPGLLLLMGLSMGLFASPNRAAVMNSLPPDQRGAGAGHDDDVPELGPGAVHRHLLLRHHPGPGLRRCPPTSTPDWWRRACPPAPPTRSPTCRPIGSLFAAFLGFNPIQQLPGPASWPTSPAGHAAYLTGRSFFPS